MKEYGNHKIANGNYTYEVTKIGVLDEQSNTPNGRSNVSNVFVSGAKLLKDVEKSYDKGKKLSYLLRHDVNALESGKIDEHGWRSLEELSNFGFTKTILEEIVLTNNKRRYEFNADKTKIRARQGHSIQVDVELERKSPPSYLYHGTTENVKALILKDGIKSMSRLYVHLSEDIETAMKVGRRHGENVVVLQIDAGRMESDGFVFFLSKNNVWLTKYVEPKYILNIIV